MVFVRIEKYLRDCVAAGQLEGTISIRQPADDLGRVLLGALLGIRVLARTRLESELLTGLIRPLFLLLQTRKLLAVASGRTERVAPGRLSFPCVTLLV
jgi:TetR/AcrR family transcriptional repressor of nem operon